MTVDGGGCSVDSATVRVNAGGGGRPVVCVAVVAVDAAVTDWRAAVPVSDPEPPASSFATPRATRTAATAAPASTTRRPYHGVVGAPRGGPSAGPGAGTGTAFHSGARMGSAAAAGGASAGARTGTPRTNRTRRSMSPR